MKGLLALAAVAALLTAGCTAPDPPESPAVGRIDGAVLGPLLDPYGNATVVLEDLGRTTTTTRLGGFTFLGVPVGGHVLSVQLPGTSGDRKAVRVDEGEVTRVILQVHTFLPALPYVANLRSHGQEDLAMPGRSCEECEWSTTLPERPDLAVLAARWDGGLADGRVVVELWNGHDLVGALEVPGDGETRSTEVARDALPGAGGQLRVTARFTEDFLPTPDLRVETFLRLHYHTAS